MKHVKTRRILGAILAAALLVSAAGCAGGNQADTSKVVVVGAATDLKTLDTAHMYEVYGNMISYALYDMLFRIEGEDMENPKPSLTTEDWTLDDTHTVYTFPLRKGVKFTSGNELTAKDVLWTINRVINLKSNTALHVEGIKTVEAPDDYTVVITLKSPDASFLTKLASNAFCILDSEVVKENGGTDAADAATADKATAWLDAHSAGSGPFKLESWTKNSELVLVKNPDYWGKSGNVEKVILKEIPDANSQINMLQSGDIDIAMSLSADNAVQLKDKAGIRLINKQAVVCSFLLMNSDPAIGKEMANPKVQQAVRLAIDYQGLLKMAGDGASLPLSIVPQGFVGAKTRPADYQNIEKAKALMKEAGYEKGFTVELTAANFESEGMKWTDIAQKVKEDLAKIGITVEIKTSEFGVILDPYRNGELPFLVMHWSPDYFDINNQLVFLPDSTVGQRAKWSAEGHQDMIDLGNKIIGESDKDKRAAYAAQLQDMMAEDCPYAFLLQHPKVLALSDKLDNVSYNALSMIQLTELNRNT